jgi:RNA recognition motif-containing protein
MGVGYVGFETKESANAAVKRMDKAKFNGKEVRVTLA